jgi:hypothetical protein
VLILFFTIPTLVTSALGALPASALSPRVESLLEGVVRVIHAISVVHRIDFLLISTGPPVFFHSQFFWNIALGMILFGISTICLDRWSAPSESNVLVENSRLRRFEVGRCWRLPIAWKEFLYFTGGRSFFVGKLLMGGLIYLGFVIFQNLSNGPQLPVQPGPEQSTIQSMLSSLSTIGAYLWIAIQQPTLYGDHGWNALLTFVFWLTAEVLLYASGVLFFEIRQLTQSTLATAPISSVRVLLEKTIGCAIATIPVLFWVAFTMVFGYQSINRYLSVTMIVSYLVMLSFSSHVAALLSLYTRWAALPLTVLVTIPAFAFLALPILALTQLSAGIAAQQGIPTSDLVVIIINVFWTWMFILLPLELWIRDRWITMTRTS